MRATITPDAADAVSPGLLVVPADGRMAYRGAALRLDKTTATLANEAPAFKNKTFTVVADARRPGHTLLEVMRALRSAGFSSISLLTERRRK
jgi:biopolymer transport protein ExbD